MLTFKLGEVAIIRNAKLRPHLNGLECTINKPLGTYRVTHLDGELHTGYGVQAADGVDYFLFPHQLRKKRPPATDDAAARQAMLECIERAKRPERADA
ncbi:hypothetical protein [Massilia antarctica]|uniref:hypothetical protein n=1 Tax=Massilia antarctica TaxID=2765360 RepID=UPI00226EB294|nr:hypothetical protein [Massilia sp. H27-R4]MCY0910867.1 hypothetical protein [Massilia sp. H27-R4]